MCRHCSILATPIYHLIRKVDEVPLDQDDWCKGHKPEREYWYLVEYYLRGIITREEILSEYRNPDHYQPECRHASSSGQHEEEGEYWADKWGPLE
ncbi:HNH/ENDO VII family nuclease [Halovivax cerinus]|uniref:HNH/ENDO VII family nuclease n=1 Tax=Halovivax cerinus TaxID=1487865 RepID=A0ABD5NQL8_9EURY